MLGGKLSSAERVPRQSLSSSWFKVSKWTPWNPFHLSWNIRWTWIKWEAPTYISKRLGCGEKNKHFRNISTTPRTLSQTCCFFHSTNGTLGTENDKPHAEVREMVLANVIVNNITRMEHQPFTHGSCRDGRCGALCWLTMRWQHDGVQMGGDQDSTLVLWQSTSCMFTTSVLTPLSLSKADSSVMLSYGGRDDGILIDFPWSLQREQSNREHPSGCT